MIKKLPLVVFFFLCAIPPCRLYLAAGPGEPDPDKKKLAELKKKMNKKTGSPLKNNDGRKESKEKKKEGRGMDELLEKTKAKSEDYEKDKDTADKKDLGTSKPGDFYTIHADFQDGSGNGILDLYEKNCYLAIKFAESSSGRPLNLGVKSRYALLKPQTMRIEEPLGKDRIVKFELYLGNRDVKAVSDTVSIYLNDKWHSAKTIPLDSKFFQTFRPDILLAGIFLDSGSGLEEVVSPKTSSASLVVKLSAHRFFRETLRNLDFKLVPSKADFTRYLAIGDLDKKRAVAKLEPGGEILIRYDIQKIYIPDDLRMNFFKFTPMVYYRNQEYKLNEMRLFIEKKPRSALPYLVLAGISAAIILGLVVFLIIYFKPVRGNFSLVSPPDRTEIRKYELLEDEITLGRAVAGTGNIKINNSFVSNKHALLKRGRKGYEIVDLNSTNGTFVNGKRIVKILLRHGDEVSLGEEIALVFKREK